MLSLLACHLYKKEISWGLGLTLGVLPIPPVLQSDLDKLEKWETSWLMAFHPEKCNVLTITKKRNPTKFNYTLHGDIKKK
jgi:hypothetical protein